ncbi:MAG: SDR family NAD(P)-dependent oxidoreductase [Proteobacteria bacterium]|nr:SDR family NAD(P)-dependent oxidoreductase [Pseudomonadota bacterium]
MTRKNGQQGSGAAIIGAACRLPGVGSLREFWALLEEGRNTVRPRPEHRWSVERFLRPGEPEPGFAYTFAGGYLDDPLAFDPAPFGISPREAQQMDPQQRLMLEVVWSAFEDAGIAPSSLKNERVGVYVGASMVDYQSGASHDPAVMESHFMTGNSLSILSNRISYVFDFHGPSFTLDSACSSSFVALDQAVNALERGEIDLAVVGGVNLCLSPAPFIGFSQARMLSPTGLSRPFSAKADGYVRSEGGVALVLRREEAAQARGEHIRSIVVATAVNSDGRTSGISLPSFEGQSSLIEDVYGRAGISPQELAFVEAHGTGTKVGDPIEARAIGTALGVKRDTPLPIGSVKSNIGHLEAASGLAGLLKSMLSLENGRLPRSLFLDEPSDTIDFAALNLAPNAAMRPLDPNGPRHAGICNYGFGGTNAHVILRAPSPTSDRHITPEAKLLLLSAADRPALIEEAKALADTLDGGVSAREAAAALGHGREVLRHRIVLPVQDGEAATLRAFVEGQEGSPGHATGVAPAEDADVVFVFSGNGAQFPEMGCAAYAANAMFRSEIAEIDHYFAPLSGWSIADALQGLNDKLTSEQLSSTLIAQPMIYAIQSALAGCLRHAGIQPSGVLGHSVGEVAAAEACGALSREQATKLIYFRSKHQESARGLGRMMVVAADADKVAAQLATFGDTAIEIAATNSVTSTTVSGPAEALKAFAKHCRSARLATVPLDIDYPFHSAALAPLEGEMLEALSFVAPQAGRVAFYSTVTGEAIPGAALDGRYWWRNVRERVRFREALSSASGAGRIFVELSARAILTGPVAESLREAGVEAAVLPSLSQKDEQDPVALLIARLVAHGAAFDRTAAFGPRPQRLVHLPGYPFQRQNFYLPDTAEAFNAYGRMSSAAKRHPLLGARMADGSPEWRNLIDPVLVPYLDDHRVDGGVIVPAAGLIEMALSAGRDLFGEVPLELPEFDITRALAIAEDETREVSTRYAEATGVIEIWSRRRFSTQDWVLHARGTVARATRGPGAVLAPPVPARTIHDTRDQVYAEAVAAGLEYGPHFALVTTSSRDEVTTDSHLAAPQPSGLGAHADMQVISPCSLDAAFHGLFISRPQKEGEKKAHLPVRFRRIEVFRHGVTVARTITLLTHETDRFKTVAISLLDAEGGLIASVEAAVLQALMLARATVADRTFHIERLPFVAAPAALVPCEAQASPEVSPAWLVMRAFAVSLAHRLALAHAKDGVFDPAALAASGAVPGSSKLLLESARVVLEGFNLITQGQLAPICPLPAPEAILSTLLSSFPDAVLEARLAAQSLTQVESVVREGKPLTPSPALVAEIETSGVLTAPVLQALREKVAKAAILSKRVLRVLSPAPWHAGVVHALGPLIEAGVIELALAAANRRDIDNARAMSRFPQSVEFLDVEDESRLASPMPYDMLVGVAGTRQDGAASLSPTLAKLVRAGAPVLLAVPGADATLDFILGVHAGWLEPVGAQDAGLDRIPAQTAARARLEALGASAVQAEASGDGLGALLSATLPGAEHVSLADDFILCGDGPLAQAVADAARQRVKAATAAEALGAPDAPSHLVVAIDAQGEPREAVARQVEALKTICETLEAAGSKARVSVFTRGALEAAPAPCPVAAGLWGFVRVAINEFPGVDLRLIDAESTLSDDALPGLLAQALALSGEELEIALTPRGLEALRMRRGLFERGALAEDKRAVLRFEQPGRLDSFDWVEALRAAPGFEEIEIEVAAVGLNYRDLLVGLGILDDDLLGAGLTAAALGFECSGVVTRVGPGVTNLSVGDGVMGFAANTFASHLTAPAWHFFKVPQGVSLEAAATIPVAFATAWFALLKRAALSRGESVLIHGGAGGVGLAAIQIAKRAGAQVIATASSPARRALAQATGATKTYDSRQNRFAEAIRTELGGVDVVLNSLAGAAMEASFKLVKPFGRFVELGKRDYLDNTRLGLRPFVRNIAYFGVDLDELLAHDRAYVEAMMAEMSALFASGELKPLPHRVFEAHEIGTAFRLMQASEHIGKIVIRPARRAVPDATKLGFAARKDGTYLVIGGAGGLGFATARWLAAKGAGTLVLASRRGKIEDGLEDALAALRAGGTKVEIAALDVTDRAAVAALVERIAREHGPVRGVIHAAVLLDDGMITGLDPQRLRASLSTKIDGAINLDAALEDQPLDFFVVYSSATTVIGSPGQGAYVAANSWFEGFARARRARGKPALAIGWGAISDVGIIARDKQLGRRLKRTTGVIGISSSESLAHLGRLLVLGNTIPAMQFYTNIAPGAAAEKLRLINSPAFADLGLARRDEGGAEGGDLLSAIEGKSQAEAIALIVQALKREISHILRMPEEQIDTARPLAELGLDSLMALELQLAIERLAGTDVPMVGAGDRKLADLAGMILNALGGERQDAGQPDLVSALASQHKIEALPDEAVSALKSGGRAAE